MATALTRSLTLNDITATITIQNGSYPENVDWILKITDTNKNNASTYGAYAITKPSITTQKPEEQSSPAKTSITTPNLKHISRIREMLDDVEKATGKHNKIIYACIVFNYILNDALEFTKTYTKFTNTVIDKCYQMKKEVPDCVPLLTLANKLLTALSAPLEKDTTATQETNRTLDKYVVELAKTDDEKAEDARRVDLMKSILKKKGLTFNESTMSAYHDWEQYYNPRYPTNRYKKMSEFAKTLKHS